MALVSLGVSTQGIASWPAEEQSKPVIDREEIAGICWLRTGAARKRPAKRYSELLPVVYKRLAEEWEIPVTWDECLTCGRSVRNWPAFSESTNALRYLKQHFKLVILSNVDNESFAHSHDKLGAAFDAIYTAEDIGSDKLASQNLEPVLEVFERFHRLAVEIRRGRGRWTMPWHRSSPITTHEPAARRPLGCPCPWHLLRPLALAVRRTAPSSSHLTTDKGMKSHENF